MVLCLIFQRRIKFFNFVSKESKEWTISNYIDWSGESDPFCAKQRWKRGNERTGNGSVPWQFVGALGATEAIAAMAIPTVAAAAAAAATAALADGRRSSITKVSASPSGQKQLAMTFFALPLLPFCLLPLSILSSPPFFFISLCFAVPPPPPSLFSSPFSSGREERISSESSGRGIFYERGE